MPTKMGSISIKRASLCPVCNPENRTGRREEALTVRPTLFQFDCCLYV